MVLNLQMRLVLVCLVVTIGCVCAKRKHGVERQGQALEDESSERQFISGIKKWFTRNGEVKLQTPTKTKIKYLPVYVPFPVQPSIKVPPPEGEYYGAYQDPAKKEEIESMYQGVQMMPNSHVVDYTLPASGQLPMYLKRTDFSPYYTPSPVPYQQELQIVGDNSHYGYGDMFTTGTFEIDGFENDDSSEYDSEVIENPEFFKNAHKKTGGRLRKIRRKNNQPRPRKFAF